MKNKKIKKICARVGALMAALILLGVMVLPVFAATTDEMKEAVIDRYSIVEGEDAAFNLLQLMGNFSAYNYLVQFTPPRGGTGIDYVGGPLTPTPFYNSTGMTSYVQYDNLEWAIVLTDSNNSVQTYTGTGVKITYGSAVGRAVEVELYIDILSSDARVSYALQTVQHNYLYYYYVNIVQLVNIDGGTNNGNIVTSVAFMGHEDTMPIDIANLYRASIPTTNRYYKRPIYFSPIDFYNGTEMGGVSEGELEAQYNEGYVAGYNQGNTEGYDSGYSVGLSNGYNSGYEEGENIGYNNGLGNSSLIDFVTALFRAPMEFIDSVLDFNIFGINFATAFRVLITMCIIAVVVVVVWKAVR